MCQWLMLTTAASSRSLRYPYPGFFTGSPAQLPTVQSWPFPNATTVCSLTGPGTTIPKRPWGSFTCFSRGLLTQSPMGVRVPIYYPGLGVWGPPPPAPGQSSTSLGL